MTVSARAKLTVMPCNDDVAVHDGPNRSQLTRKYDKLKMDN